MKKGIVFDIKKYAIHDGPGIRTTVFLKGCPLACRWCHNPESQGFAPEKIIKTVRRNGGRPVTRSEVVGRAATVSEVIAEVEKDIIFYDESGGGVTFSGGEPLAQPGFLAELLKECRAREIHTAVDTTGYAPAGTMTEIAGLTDLFLYDLKIMDPEKHVEYTGIPNRLILENLKRIAAMNRPVVVRFPMIPGLTDSEENVRAIAGFVSDLGNIRDIAVLPYHDIADGKYAGLGVRNRMKGVVPPDAEAVGAVRSLFESYGFQVSIGG
ncbi:hypothetical protein DENIS_0843 [Desulfonema ishimotonii]|uniref:Radical SAM core domain-containing protein n=1 Tax=Desulfonema ishimotonii TaxID=45657 RepID=A0A401FSF2_9BACT|nr:glycyl-radical enzyme activating protein [Desulfonema ishimotonii]GBC59901.1 hypothetical protein DENIS_0843 [Desulfonema ishimotonii]